MDCLRIDKWLWFARFFKTRSLAAAVVEDAKVWINDRPVAKPSAMVRPGDVVVFPTGPRWRRVTVVAVGDRRGPAPEAQTLYHEDEAAVPR